MMQRTSGLKFFCLAVCISLGLSCYPAYGAQEAEETKPTISTGMNLPQFKLDAPGTVKEQQYLGLKDRKPFYLSQIPARLIVLEIFSFYCPHCRNQAPKLNKLYKFIQQNRDLSNDIKMIGITAAGDHKLVDKWKTSLHVPFPVFPDADTAIWKELGKPGVPCTLVMNKTGKILSIHDGVTEDIEEFFRQIKKFHKQQ